MPKRQISLPFHILRLVKSRGNSRHFDLQMKIMQTIINKCVTSTEGIIALKLQASLARGRLRAGED